MTDRLLRKEEKIVFALRELYQQYGYLPYQMSKFEEYELYIQNKEFMVSDRVIAFNDTNGKLLALKPDVTLSIIKSGEDESGQTQKVYYNENVYRVSKNTHRFKEIMQCGLECIGEVGLYDIYEVLTLAAESLKTVSDKFVLVISHLGVLNALLSSMNASNQFKQAAIGFIAEKNMHDLKRLCDENGVSEEAYNQLCMLIRAYGNRKKVLEALRTMPNLTELGEIEALSKLLDESPYSDNIQFDCSLVGDMNYYNGLLFKGFVDGIATDVLSGGQYDKLMQKMGRSSKAIGFALYMDLLEYIDGSRSEYDVDCLVIYDDKVPFAALISKIKALQKEGRSVSAQKAIPTKLRYRELIDLRGE